ncbi:MAG: tRNA pseudouridine(38-40) synthase TruA [Clostridia bacterium]|nr:tRNA pseudouridine(38-40) synthase TruA [Clostridia bacterium]
MKLFLKLKYVGTDFCGYQVQKDKRTVQGELTRAARELFSYECDVTGCSRTDSGVHANTFCVTVAKKGENDIITDIDVIKIPRAMSAHLPDDISVFEASLVDSDFHPRYDVKYKEYVYRIYNGNVRDPFEMNRSLYLPQTLSEDAIARMKEAAGHFVGQHDFSAFMAQGSQVESTVRNVVYADVAREGDIITFKVSADGFLYNMVRIMVGTLISVGLGKIQPSDIPEIILSGNRERAGMTAAAHGLYLNKVIY